MNLAYHYPTIFWNTANLIIDSGAPTSFDDDEDEIESLDFDENGEPIIEEQKAKANTTIDYGKVASAIGRMQNFGIKVLPPNINESHYTFTPDAKNNILRYGLKGITRVGDNIIEEIIQKRPFTSFDDFMKKVKVNKLQAVNLIKSGAFDDFTPRESLMEEYIESISGTKKVLNLRNVNMLINYGLSPEELDLERRVFNFNKYLRPFKKEGWITLDEIAMNFYQNNFNMDKLTIKPNGEYCIEEAKWKKIYDSHMDKYRSYIKKNQEYLLTTLNGKLVDEMREKYASGTLAKWSMDSVSFYQDEHELANVNYPAYGLTHFNSLPREPEVDYKFKTKEGHEITMFKLSKIAGTVIDKDKTKSLITILTTEGVVPIKAYGIMPQYDKQISETAPDGTKKVVEKSTFTRGHKIIAIGMRRGDTFFAKKYKNTGGHHFSLIKKVNEDGSLEIQEGRTEVIA